jgi:hypothetical protein
MAGRRTKALSSKEKKKEAEVSHDISSELAMKMIEKELELEKNCNSVVVHELIDLYSEAIEYYSIQENPKYLDFQNRMHKMLVKPEVLKVVRYYNSSYSSRKTSPSPPESRKLENIEEKPVNVVKVEQNNLETIESVGTPLLSSAQNKKPNPESPEKTLETEKSFTRSEHTAKTAPIIKPPIPDAHKNYNFASKSPLPVKKKLSEQLLNANHKKTRTLNIIIDRQSSNTKDTAIRAVNDFKSQDSALEKRLASRKKIQLTRSMNSSFYSKNDTSQVSGYELSDVDEENDSSTKSSCFVIEENPVEHSEKYEKMLEEIMDKNFGEKAMKIAETKQKYESQIAEISGMGSIMQLVVDQMKANMEEDIRKIVIDYDSKRKEEIAKLNRLY